MDPSELSRNLRLSPGETMARRRAIIALELFSVLVMGLISLFQAGAIKHLPEPPVEPFDGDKIHGSAQAYQFFQIPDGVLGLISYAVTLALAAKGSSERTRRQPWLPVALGAKTALDAAAAAKLFLDQPLKHRAVSFFAILSGLATFRAAFLAWPEASTAWEHLRNGD